MKGKVTGQLTAVFFTVALAVAMAGPAQGQSNVRLDPALRVARDVGFEDGALVGRQDLFHGKAFQPFPRGKYAHEDRGYRREYGDKFAYEQEYATAYHQGYLRGFHR